LKGDTPAPDVERRCWVGPSTFAWIARARSKSRQAAASSAEGLDTAVYVSTDNRYRHLENRRLHGAADNLSLAEFERPWWAKTEAQVA
jgi:hypothetical protein